jgi:hypothetical protein
MIESVSIRSVVQDQAGLHSADRGCRGTFVQACLSFCVPASVWTRERPKFASSSRTWLGTSSNVRELAARLAVRLLKLGSTPSESHRRMQILIHDVGFLSRF